MRIIGHIDFDAFFASVEERDNPWLKGLPVVVGSDPHSGRGVVATCNYKAREYGIHSAMPITKAWQLSQNAKREKKQEVIFITPTHRKYGKVSSELFTYIQEQVPSIQKVSVDEAYLDLSFLRSYKKAEAFAKKLQQGIKTKFKLTASIGIGPNKMIAKIASEEKKPHGLFVCLPRDVYTYLGKKTVRALPGVGNAFERKLKAKGFYSIRDIQEGSWEALESIFGSHGIELFQKAYGTGSEVIYTEPRTALSIGEEETFAVDTLSLKFLTNRLSSLCEDVLTRMETSGVKSIQTITLKIRFADFETHTARTTISTPTKNMRIIYASALKLLLPFLENEKNPHKKPIRLIGVSVSKLVY